MSLFQKFTMKDGTIKYLNPSHFQAFHADMEGGAEKGAVVFHEKLGALVVQESAAEVSEACDSWHAERLAEVKGEAVQP